MKHVLMINNPEPTQHKWKPESSVWPPAANNDHDYSKPGKSIEKIEQIVDFTS